MTEKLSFRLNGSEHEIPSEWIGRRLLDYLREELGLVGTKEGCGEGDCGACTVLVDDLPLCACLLLCGVVVDHDVVTIEGLPETFLERFAQVCEKHGGLQCGFCTSGFTMMSAWLDKGGTDTGNESPSQLLAGNICRCGAYQPLAQVMEEFTS